MINCVSFVYLEEYGELWMLVDFDWYWVVNYVLFSSGWVLFWEYCEDGCILICVLCSWVMVNNVESYIVCCLFGLGLI